LALFDLCGTVVDQYFDLQSQNLSMSRYWLGRVAHSGWRTYRRWLITLGADILWVKS